MRELINIILEASIFSRGTYTFGHKVKISVESAKGKHLLELIQQAIPNFEPNEELEWVKDPGPDAVLIPFGRASSERYFKRANGEYITIQGSDSTIEGALNHAGRFNRGDIAEGILGAALSAKLIKRGSDKIGDITVEDVKLVLHTALTSATELKYTVADKNSQVSDIVNFILRLPSGSMDIIKNESMWSRFEDLFQSAVHYCNSADAERYSNYFYQNGKVDEVYIESDGVSDQKGRKTDVKAVVNTTDPKTGKVIERTLKNVDISLKADSKKYGQSTSGGLTQSPEVWLKNANKLFMPLGITIDMPPNATSILEFWIDVYQQAADKLNTALRGASANNETAFIEKIADFVKHHGTAGNVNIKLVNFEKGLSTVHSFNLIKQRLIDYKIDLAAKYAICPLSGKPTIFIYDTKSNAILTAIRFYLTEKASTNYLEKGELLDVLTRVEKTRQPPAKPTVPPPVPEPTNPIPQQNPQQELPIGMSESRQRRSSWDSPRQKR